MGQCHYLINLDKKQFVHPHQIGNGLKLYEQVGWEYSTATALVMLLAASSHTNSADVAPSTATAAAVNHPANSTADPATCNTAVRSGPRCAHERARPLQLSTYPASSGWAALFVLPP